jgi:hypothetical protein
MPRSTTLILLIQSLFFATASLVHGGVLLHGYEHATASLAEAIIATVLAGGLVVGLAQPAWSWRVALGVQVFALLGDGIGTYLAIIGVGASTVPDIVFHVGMLVFLIAGIVVVWNQRPAATAA